MADHGMPPPPLFDHQRQVHQLPINNDVMVADLKLRSEEAIAAFRAVDRRHFWVEGSTELVYADMPLRYGRLHLSAPQIYAEALESLMPLSPGMSFLNVGSGTGYFNSVVSELIGELATNHGIDIHLETLTHARQRCCALGKQGIELFEGNVYQLNVHQTMRYDRIYLGACANSRSKYLYRLLEVGGVLVGPFQAGRHQQLRRVVRRTESRFSVEVLESVRFASLVEPPPGFSAPSRPSSSCGGSESRRDSASQLGLPGVSFTFALNDRPWTPGRAAIFPPSFRAAVVALSLLCRPRDEGTCFLPREIWVQHIFPWCPRWWFEALPAARRPRRLPATTAALPPSAAAAERAGAAAGKEVCGGTTADDADLSDDGGSTRVPSNTSSAIASPLSVPGEPPSAFDTEDATVAVDVDDDLVGEGESDDVLFEVLNGHSHAIGAGGDPDDYEPDELRRQHMAAQLPVQVLQLLAGAARARHEMFARGAPPVDEEGDHDEIELDYEGYEGDETDNAYDEDEAGGSDEEMDGTAVDMDLDPPEEVAEEGPMAADENADNMFDGDVAI